MSNINQAKILAIRKNILGTIFFTMQIKGMRKPQEFAVYPITKENFTEPARIQSHKRIGFLNLNTGEGTLSQSHPNGAYIYHYQTDVKTPFILSDIDLVAIRLEIKMSAGELVGSSVVKTDNSGASLI